MSKNTNTKLTLKTVALIAMILTFLAGAVFSVQLLILNMLPLAYSLLIVLVLVLIPVLMALAIHRGGKKPLRYIVILILTVVMVGGCVFGSIALGKLQATLNAITGQEEDTNIYIGVYVRQDDPAAGIKDASGYTFAFTAEECTWDPQEAIQGISLLTDTAISTKEYDTVFAVADALKSGEVNAALINVAYTELFEDVEGYESFLSDTRLLYEHAVKEQLPPEDPGFEEDDPEVTEPADPTDPTEPTEPAEKMAVDPFILYLSGSDTRSSTLRKSRSDVNILAVVNPNTHQILLINTPRDYYVTLGGTKDSMDKLTHSTMYSMKTAIRTMEKLYGCDIDYYARINFSGFEKMIDSIGGIDIHSDIKFITDDDIWIYEGNNHLNGEAALSFARERHHLKGGDNARGKNQMKVIAAVVDKVTSGTTIITKYAEILESLGGMFTTDMPMEKMSELVQFQLTEMPKWEIYSYAVTGVGAHEFTHSIPTAKTYVMKPNKSTVKHAKSLIKSVLKGNVLTEADMTISKS